MVCLSVLVYVDRLKMDIYAKSGDNSSTRKPWTDQEVLMLLEVGGHVMVAR